MSKPTTKEIQAALLDAAQQARENSYSPYSHFKVGAAVFTRQGHIFTGTNIENASYGLTVCAERNATFAAVGAGEKDIVALALVTQKLPGAKVNSPCGACRQVLAEFMPPDAPIYMAMLDGKKRTVITKKLKDLIPLAFNLS